MEGFFWAGRSTSTTYCASLAWHFVYSISVTLVIQADTPFSNDSRSVSLSRKVGPFCIRLPPVSSQGLKPPGLEKWNPVTHK